MSKNRTQEGNALFLILIAVALFAALSYAVTQSGNSGGKYASSETSRLKAAEILQWYGLLRSEMMRFTIIDSIAPVNVRISSGNTWTPCSSGSDCLWAPDGGGVEYPPPLSIPGDGFRDAYNGSAGIAGFTTEHHYFWIYYGSDEESEALCSAYQKLLNLGPYGTSATTYPGEYTACYLHWSGNYVIYFIIYVE